jgi:hypothetical protein
MSDRPDEHADAPAAADEPMVAHEPPPARLGPPAAAAAPAAAPTPTRAQRASPVGWIALILALAEAAALVFLYLHPNLPPALDDRLSSLDSSAHAAAASADQAAGAAHANDAKIATLSQTITTLQNRPPPAPPPAFDPKPLQDQIAALKSDLDHTRTDTANALALATAAQKADESDQSTLNDQSSKLTAQASQLTSLSSKLDGQSSKLDDATSKLAALSTKFGDQSSNLNTLSSRFDQASAASRKVASLASGAERLARLQAASVALSIGRPTGQIPGAPPALAHFATAAPPTEASLILAFPDAANATLKASEPQTAGQGFFQRLWTRIQSAVTVRDGTRVLVGDPAAGIVAAARERLAAGDLEGAVSTLGALTGAAADAMDDWRSRAAALVDARAALAGMMARQ